MTTGGMRSFAELVVIVATALFFALAIQAFAVKPYVIPSESMLPTLEVGQRLLVDRFSHRIAGDDPTLGDITVFMPPPTAENAGGQCGLAGEGPSYDSGAASRRSCSRAAPGAGRKAFVKRIVGVPGDTIAVRDGHVVRNGKLAREPFTLPCDGAECTLEPIEILAGHYFLMGDNRGNSDDSRYWGPVPRDQIIGRAVVTYWPIGRIGPA